MPKTAAEYIERVHHIGYGWYLPIHDELSEDWPTLHRQLRRLYGGWARTLQARRKWQKKRDLPDWDGCRDRRKYPDPLQSLAGILSGIGRSYAAADPVDRWAASVAERLAAD